MADEGQLPDWLAEMREEPLEADTPAEPPAEGLEDVPEPFTMEAEEEPGAAEDLQSLFEPPDMVDDLREQVTQSYQDEEAATRAPVAGVFPGMKPWQGLVLAVLFFLDVAVCGAMILAMAGRIGF
jgi:hypothetical protein